jgi:uroporphyrinogen decarboxylase
VDYNFILRLRRLVEQDRQSQTIRSIRGVELLRTTNDRHDADRRLNRREGRPPVWMMRQASRYHSHYQMLKRYNDFITLCREPELAAEVALGPIHDFNFDAAILFSDLLFPLEAMGMGLRYDPGPKLDFHLRSMADVARLTGGAQRASHMQFQADAVTLTRRRLRADKGLIGFVGGPFTLYVYAAAGSHERAQDALAGLENGVYAAFNDKLLDLLAHNMALQSKAGAECVALFDTAAGEIDPTPTASTWCPCWRTCWRGSASWMP